MTAAPGEATFGRYTTDPSIEQLDRYFHLDHADRALVEMRRGDHNRLGFAVQLGTVRFLGTFLADPTDVPGVVTAYVAGQLDLADPGILKGYAVRRSTQWEHAEQIRQAYGYRHFTDPDVQEELTVWLAARSRTMADRASALSDLAVARLIEARVLLPGPSLLERLIASVRDTTVRQLHTELAAVVDASVQRRLRRLLVVDPVARTSSLERLRKGPSSITAAGLLGAIERLAEIHRIGVTDLDLSALPTSRIQALAAHAQTARVQAVQRMAEPRRTATLLAAARVLEAAATDDMLDLLDRLLGALLSRSQRAEQRDRLHGLPALDVAARSLREVVALLLDPPDGGLPAVWTALEDRGLTRDRVADAVDAVDELSRTPESWTEQLLTRYITVRRFLPALLDALILDATGAGEPVLAGLEALRGLEGRRKIALDDVPTELATGVWKRLKVADDGGLDRRAFTFCVLERLRDALRRRDVFAPTSNRWTDPRTRLLSGPAWEAVRAEVCVSLNHQPTPAAELAALSTELDAAYQGVAQRLAGNDAVRIETTSGRDRPF